MPAPSTVVTFTDADGDEFPIRLPGVHREHREAEVRMAREIAHETREFTFKAPLTFKSVEYFNEAKP